MSIARPLLTLVLVLLACTERPLETTESGTTDPGTGGTSPASSTADPGTTMAPGTATTVAPTTGDPGTTTELPSTTTESPGTATVTVSTSEGTTAVDPSETTEAPPDPWGMGGLVGCFLDAPAGTDVAGPSAIGDFAAQRAYFGWAGAGEPFSPTLLFVSPGADPAVELAAKDGSTGAILHIYAWTDESDQRSWIGTWPAFGTLFDKGMSAFASRPDSVTITGFAGNWDAPDPDDPPRLLGALEGPISGPFDAVYCNLLVEIIIPE